MNVKFNERKAKIYSDRKEYIEKKCEKLNKYFGEEADATVAYSFNRNEHTVELTVSYRSFYFRAEETADDMLKAVDGVVASIERQIQKNKTRLSKKTRQESFAKSLGAEEVAELELEIGVMPDSYGNGMYEAVVSELTDASLKNTWMTAFTPELVQVASA